MTIPPDACDCHIHVFEEGRALAPTATFKPPNAPVPAYREIQKEIGFTRVLVVQPTGYAFDNGCTLDAMAQLGPGARGIAVVPQDVSGAELERLNRAGMRGVRFMMLAGGVLGWDSLDALAARIAPLNWIINLQLDGRDLPMHETRLARLPCRLSIDHLAKFLGPTRVEDEAFRSLCHLLDSGNCWIKLSAPYESSRSGPPDYADVAPLARELALRYPERCLWASNWPHPNINPHPSCTQLLEWIFRHVESEAGRHKMLVDNPAELYGF